MGVRTGIVLLALACLLGAVACGPGGPPSNHDPARYGTVRVKLHPTISSESRRAIVTDTLEMLDALGPDFVLVDSANEADITIAPLNGSISTPDTCFCVPYVYHEMHEIRVDEYRCFLRAPAARVVLAHAVEIYLGMRRATDAIQPAIINNRVEPVEQGDEFSGSVSMLDWYEVDMRGPRCFDPDATDSRFYSNAYQEITQVDIDEFVRTHP
jgi:hypothetical protein